MVTTTLDIEGMDNVIRQLRKHQERGANISPILANFGEHMVNSTRDNFESSTAPDGTPWARNSPATFASILGSSHVRKDGRINKRGTNRVMSKSPLIRNHTLMRSIRYQVSGNGLSVGTNMVYARMMHFGGKKSTYGNLWGDIPARPFLGINEMDKQILLGIVSGYIVG